MAKVNTAIPTTSFSFVAKILSNNTSLAAQLFFA
jgi:hypothetical protein